MRRIISTLATVWRIAIPYFRSEDRWAGRILLAAVVASGVAGSRWVFEGFLPRSGAERERAIGAIAADERASVIYEAGNRVGETLRELAAAFRIGPVVHLPPGAQRQILRRENLPALVPLQLAAVRLAAQVDRRAEGVRREVAQLAAVACGESDRLAFGQGQILRQPGAVPPGVEVVEIPGRKPSRAWGPGRAIPGVARDPRRAWPHRPLVE